MEALNYHKATFLRSVISLSHLPPDKGSEIIFTGKSNAGKSSALNALTNQKHLARTSKIPGRTQTLNFFQIDDKHRLVDLPGFGYAEVPWVIQEQWKKVIDDYLRTRRSLRGIILVKDIRHPPGDFEYQMLDWAQAANLPIHIILTKADKLRKGGRLTILRELRGELKRSYPSITLSLFSAREDIGRDALRAQLDQWFLAKEF